MSMQEQIKSALQSKSKRLHRLYLHVFNTPEGQEVLADICRHGYIDTPTYVLKDPQRTFLNEGQRALALFILKRINKEPRVQITEQIEESNHQ